MPEKYPTSRSTVRFSVLCLNALVFLGIGLLSGCGERGPDIVELKEKSRRLLELESCHFVYHDIVYQGKLEKLLGLLTTKDTRVLFSVDIQVSAGIDLQAMNTMDLKPLPTNSKGLPGLLVSLPPARVIAADADENTIHQYFLYEYGITGQGRVNWLDYQEEIQRSKDRAVADAIKRGLLNTAWENAAASLGSFFRLAGFGEVRVEKTGGQP